MDFTVLANAVEVDHGIKRVSMRFIKKYAAPGRARLSQELCTKITDALREQGLITLPHTLPPDEDAFIFVMARNSVLGDAASLSVAIFAMARFGMLTELKLEETFPHLAVEAI